MPGPSPASQLVDELWSHIFGLLRPMFDEMDSDGDIPQAVAGHTRFLRILTVSQTWANNALPHLYHHIHIRDPRTLSRLASLLLTTPPDHPRQTWTKSITLDIPPMTVLRKVTAETLAEIPLWVTILLTCSKCLRELTIENANIWNNVLDTNVNLLGRQLITLSIWIDPQSVHALRVLPYMIGLRSLCLAFTSEWEWETRNSRLSLEGIPPLMMPNVISFWWEWFETNGTLSAAQYVASCRFDPTCKFVIGFNGISAEQMTTLNPFFLAHHSKYVCLLNPISQSSTVLVQSRSVRFRGHFPPLKLLDGDLPPLLTLELSTPSQVNELWCLMDMLAKTTRRYNTVICIWATVRWAPDAKIDVFLWQRDPDYPLHEKDAVMTLRLMQYARVLALKGIILCDGLLRGYRCYLGEVSVRSSDVYLDDRDLQKDILEASK